jgi:hypothetical protein
MELKQRRVKRQKDIQSVFENERDHQPEGSRRDFLLSGATMTRHALSSTRLPPHGSPAQGYTT